MIRATAAACFWLLLGNAAFGQRNLSTRYELDADLEVYAMNTPRIALDSVILALQQRKYDYLLAHLTDPDYVDLRVAREHRGEFAGLVKEARDKLANDPEVLTLFRRFARDGKFEEGEAEAVVSLPDTPHRIFFRKLQNRWFMKDEREAGPPPPGEQP